jgi:hypothetical protein
MPAKQGVTQDARSLSLVIAGAIQREDVVIVRRRHLPFLVMSIGVQR